MEIIFKKGIEPVDFDMVTDWLKDTYWSPGISKAEVVFGTMHSSLVVSGFEPAGNQVSFLRVVSDRARFAYLADVIVDPARRGQGIGRAMVRFAMGSPEMSMVYQWLLRTRDAHGVYVGLGFTMMDRPQDWMLIQKPREARPFSLPPDIQV
jgi:ribosomal protein S18 acetylase RimI-like enzyme